MERNGVTMSGKPLRLRIAGAQYLIEVQQPQGYWTLVEYWSNQQFADEAFDRWSTQAANNGS